MTVLVQRQTRDLRQGVDSAPVHAFLFCPGEHAVRAFVRTPVGAIFAGDGFIRPDGFQHTLTAVCPGIALAAANAVGHNGLIGNVLLVAGGAAGTVVRWILVALPGEQTVSGLIDAGAIPVRLADHLLAPVGKVLVGERRIDSVRHDDSSNHEKRAAAYSPSPWSACFPSFSSRLCSCSRTAFSLSGIGRPM